MIDYTFDLKRMAPWNGRSIFNAKQFFSKYNYNRFDDLVNCLFNKKDFSDCQVKKTKRCTIFFKVDYFHGKNMLYVTHRVIDNFTGVPLTSPTKDRCDVNMFECMFKFKEV